MGRYSYLVILFLLLSTTLATRADGGVRCDTTYMGHRRQLVVLAAYGDRSFQDDAAMTLAKWDRIFNEENLSESPFIGSIHDYFYDQSYGLFDVTFDLQYVLLGPASRYASSSYDDSNSQYLVNDVVDALLNRTIDWGAYDWDGDGEVNQLLIIFAGKGMNEGASEAVWPHQYWLSQHVYTDSLGYEHYCKPRSVSDGDHTYLVDSYCAVQEQGISYHPFGTICHEYSHCFGFPDFYYGYTQFVDAWDLMDNGSYNGGGYCPPDYSAHERWLMGWLTPTELTGDTTITRMAALHERPEAYLVRNDGYPDEYYILENRQPGKWDAHTGGSGLLIFHIDYAEEYWTDPLKWPNTPQQQHYILFHANNGGTCGGWPYPYGDNHALTDSSMPASTLWYSNLSGNYLMSKPVTNISVTDGIASFDFMKSEPTAIHSLPADNTPADNSLPADNTHPAGDTPASSSTFSTAQLLYEFGSLQIYRLPDGSIRKVLKPRFQHNRQ